MLSSIQIEMLCFAALGAFFLWIRLKYSATFFEGLDDLINEIFDDFRPRVLVHMAIFVIIGAISSVYVIDPATKRQAFVAGAAFTVVLGDLVKVTSRRRR